jgi:hypothetical protein
MDCVGRAVTQVFIFIYIYLYIYKKIVLLEFKRTSDCGESYFQDMRRVAEQQHVPILTGLRALAGERGWELEVVPMVAGQRSVREKEWLEDPRETRAYAPR